jgi:hypothetical protein
MAPSQAIEFNGQTIHIAEEMNLIEMHKASGKSKASKPYNWSTKEGAEFIANRKTKDTGGVLFARSQRPLRRNLRPLADRHGVRLLPEP